MDKAQRQALIDEGMTEGEADFMLSGGTKTEGLTPPAPQSDVRDADEPLQPADQATQQPAQQADAPQQTEEDDDDPSPAKDSPFYPQWHREKKKRQALQNELKQEREARARDSADLTDLREKWARIDERLSVFRQAAEQPQETQQPAPPPDPEQDPFGYMRWLGEKVSGLERGTEVVATHVQARDTEVALKDAYITDARRFGSETPEFWASYKWLIANRHAELDAAGYKDPNERNRIVLADERDIVMRALVAQRNDSRAPGPAQVMYALAKARGFQMPAAAPAANGAANGAARNGAQSNGASAQPSVTQQVENIQRGQAASRSLSSAGGAPIPQGLDIAKLASMSDDEFLQFARSMTPAQRKELDGLMGAGAR